MPVGHQMVLAWYEGPGLCRGAEFLMGSMEYQLPVEAGDLIDMLVDHAYVIGDHYHCEFIFPVKLV